MGVLMWGSSFWCKFLQLGGLCCYPPSPTSTILLYKTSRFSYIKHKTSFLLTTHSNISVLNFKLGVQTNYPLASVFSFCTLPNAFPTSYHMKTKLFVLVEYENSAVMHIHSIWFSMLPNAEWLIGEDSQSIALH